MQDSDTAAVVGKLHEGQLCKDFSLLYCTADIEEDEPPPPGLEEGKGGDDSYVEDEDKSKHMEVDANNDKEQEDEDAKKEEKSDDDPDDSVSYIDIQCNLTYKGTQSIAASDLAPVLQYGSKPS
jgi:hypothetical protein